MGSGGPRGLQILLSGGSPVRGGFDSHPFPPTFLPVCLTLVALFAGSGRAAAEPVTTEPPVVAAPVDTAGPGTPRVQAADTLATGHEAKKPFFKSPTGIMFRSLLIPGWGQATNHAWVKAVLVAGAETALAVSVIQDTHELSTLTASDPQYATIYDHRQRNAWWLGGVVFLSMVDAYVDAHLKGFDVQLGPEPSDNELRVTARIGVK
jgi:Family of unknown function (DUF5683)